MMTACDSEVLGLIVSGTGRSCCHHDCHSMVVVPNDILHFKLTMIDVMGGGKEVENEDTMPEEAIKVVLVQDGTKLCTLDFLSRSIVEVEKDKARHIGRFEQVIELCDHSTNKTMLLKKSKRNRGIASFRLLENIQE
jgi:hypothetical protein